MSAAAVKPSVQVLRQIISELRRVLPTGNFTKDNLSLRYILAQHRRFQATDEQLCRAREEMQYVAKTYLCYLRSSRLQHELHMEYHGRGERTVKEIADIVGFKLPHDKK